jgi:hypothetical protein
MSCANCATQVTLQPNQIQKTDISNNVGPFAGFVRNPFTTSNLCSANQTAYTGTVYDNGRSGTVYDNGRSGKVSDNSSSGVVSNGNLTAFFTCASNVDEAYANFQAANQNDIGAYTFQWSQSNYLTNTGTSSNGYTTNACVYNSGPVNAIRFSYAPLS